MEERLSSRSVAELCFAATRGIFEYDGLASSSFLAAIRRAFALLRKQYSRLSPPNSEIMQQPNTIAVMLPLRFHSGYRQYDTNFGLMGLATHHLAPRWNCSLQLQLKYSSSLWR